MSTEQKNTTELEETLDKIIKRYSELSEILTSGISKEDLIKVTKEFSQLEHIIPAIMPYKKALTELKDMEEILNEPDLDVQMKNYLKSEILNIKRTIKETEYETKLALLPKDLADEKNSIIEIRPGAGGDEASLFALSLLNMYKRFAERQNWKVEVLSFSETETGGTREASILVKGKGAYSKLKFESGVHRVQRVPKTESSGRIHTSTATVAVLPEAEDIDVDINENDLIIDTYKSSGAGGQHVNTTDSAVRIRHKPTGIVVAQQSERSQHKNKAKAMKILRARIYEAERKKQEEEISSSRKLQVGSGDRSEKIRTYNFPQGRVTDHRINITLHKIEQILDGDLNEITEALIRYEQSNKLATGFNIPE